MFELQSLEIALHSVSLMSHVSQLLHQAILLILNPHLLLDLLLCRLTEVFKLLLQGPQLKEFSL